MTFKAADVLMAPIVADGAVEQVFRRVGEAIGSGFFEAEMKLPSEVELARMLNVAPMTVRQALAALREEGYIETRRGRGGGSFVRADALLRRNAMSAENWSGEQLEELTVWRCAVSGEAAAQAATHAARPEIEHLRHAHAAATTRTAQASGYRSRDARFHIAIAELSGSRRLLTAEIEIQHELSALIAPVPGAELVRVTSGHGHVPIVNGIEAGQPETSREAAIRHAQATRDWLIGLHLGAGDTESNASP